MTVSFTKKAARILAATLTVGSASLPANDLETAGLKGAVIYRESRAALYSGSKATPNGIERCEYDENGNLISIVDLGPDGKLTERDRFRYDETGRDATIVETYYADFYRPEGELGYVRSMRYDADRRPIEERSYSVEDATERVFRREYDASARLRAVYTESDEGFESGSLYDYDDAGRLVSEATVDAEGNVHWLVETVYDSDGRKIELRFFASEHESRGIRHYSYDDEGRLVSETSLNAAGKTTDRMEYTYDGFGHLATSAEYYEGSLERQVTTLHDRAGRLVERLVRSGAGTLRYRELRGYDAHGNLSSHEELTMADDGVTVARRLWTRYSYEYGS